MTIYSSTKVLPYVYLLTHKTTNEFYIGVRYANKVPSSEDLGNHYYTSSTYVKNLGFENFDWVIIAEFFDKQDAIQFEKTLLTEFWKHPLKLNKTIGGIKFSGNYLRNPKTKLRLQTMNIGRKCPDRSEEWKIKQRNSHLGRKDDHSAFLNKSKAQSGVNNPRCKTWLLLSEYGMFLEVRDIKNWSKNRKINPDMLKNTRFSQKFIHGWTMIEEIL